MSNINQLAKQFNQASDKYCKEYDVYKNEEWILMKLQEEVGELFQAFLMNKGQARDKGHSKEELKTMLGEESADVLGMILTFIADQNINIEPYIQKKWNFDPKNT